MASKFDTLLPIYRQKMLDFLDSKKDDPAYADLKRLPEFVANEHELLYRQQVLSPDFYALHTEFVKDLKNRTVASPLGQAYPHKAEFLKDKSSWTMANNQQAMAMLKTYSEANNQAEPSPEIENLAEDLIMVLTFTAFDPYRQVKEMQTMLGLEANGNLFDPALALKVQEINTKINAHIDANADRIAKDFVETVARKVIASLPAAERPQAQKDYEANKAEDIARATRVLKQAEQLAPDDPTALYMQQYVAGVIVPEVEGVPEGFQLAYTNLDPIPAMYIDLYSRSPDITIENEQQLYAAAESTLRDAFNDSARQASTTGITAGRRATTDPASVDREQLQKDLIDAFNKYPGQNLFSTIRSYDNKNVDSPFKYNSKGDLVDGQFDEFTLGDNSDAGLAKNRYAFSVIDELVRRKDEALARDHELTNRAREQWLVEKDKWQQEFKAAEAKQVELAANFDNADEILKELRQTLTKEQEETLENLKDPVEIREYLDSLNLKTLDQIRSSDFIKGLKDKHGDDKDKIINDLLIWEASRRELQAKLHEPSFELTIGDDPARRQAELDGLVSIWQRLGAVIEHKGPLPEASVEQKLETLNLKVNDRLVTPAELKKLYEMSKDPAVSAADFAAHRRVLGAKVLDRMVEKAEEVGVAKKYDKISDAPANVQDRLWAIKGEDGTTAYYDATNIAAAMDGRFPPPPAEPIFFNPHFDDIKLAWEGTPIRDGYNFPTIENGETALLRDAVSQKFFGSTDTRQQFILARLHDDRIPDDKRYADIDPNSDLGKLTKARIDGIAKHEGSAFQYYRIDFSDPRKISPRDEYHANRINYLNQEAARRGQSLTATFNTPKKDHPAAEAEINTKEPAPGGHAPAP